MRHNASKVRNSAGKYLDFSRSISISNNDFVLIMESKEEKSPVIYSKYTVTAQSNPFLKCMYIPTS